jgi:hypothetical protein
MAVPPSPVGEGSPSPPLRGTSALRHGCAIPKGEANPLRHRLWRCHLSLAAWLRHPKGGGKPSPSPPMAVPPPPKGEASYRVRCRRAVRTLGSPFGGAVEQRETERALSASSTGVSLSPHPSPPMAVPPSPVGEGSPSPPLRGTSALRHGCAIPKGEANPLRHRLWRCHLSLAAWLRHPKGGGKLPGALPQGSAYTWLPLWQGAGETGGSAA